MQCRMARLCKTNTLSLETLDPASSVCFAEIYTNKGRTADKVYIDGSKIHHEFLLYNHIEAFHQDVQGPCHSRRTRDPVEIMERGRRTKEILRNMVPGRLFAADPIHYRPSK
jgi:hypothetical protein